MVGGKDEDGVVLIVDDDEAIRDTLTLALQLENHATDVACDGRQALAWLRGHRPPRLILLDLMMPIMDGWQLLDELKKDEGLARVPVVVITAFPSDLGSATRFPVLRKPIHLDDLLRIVGRYQRAGA